MPAATQTAPDTMALTRQRVSAILLQRQRQAADHAAAPARDCDQQVVSEVNRAVVENPELLECTAISLVMAVSTIVKWDLEIGQTAYLVPFNTKVSKSPDRWEKRAKALRDWKGDIGDGDQVRRCQEGRCEMHLRERDLQIRRRHEAPYRTPPDHRSD